MPSNKGSGFFSQVKDKLGLLPTPEYSMPRSIDEVRQRVNYLLRVTTPAEIIGKPLIGGLIGYWIGGNIGGIMGATTLSSLDILTLLEKPETPNN